MGAVNIEKQNLKTKTLKISLTRNFLPPISSHKQAGTTRVQV